jgi:hypothetical protein
MERKGRIFPLSEYEIRNRSPTAEAERAFAKSYYEFVEGLKVHGAGDIAIRVIFNALVSYQKFKAPYFAFEHETPRVYHTSYMDMMQVFSPVRMEGVYPHDTGYRLSEIATIMESPWFLGNIKTSDFEEHLKRFPGELYVRRSESSRSAFVFGYYRVGNEYVTQIKFEVNDGLIRIPTNFKDLPKSHYGDVAQLFRDFALVRNLREGATRHGGFRRGEANVHRHIFADTSQKERSPAIPKGTARRPRRMAFDDLRPRDSPIPKGTARRPRRMAINDVRPRDSPIPKGTARRPRRMAINDVRPRASPIPIGKASKPGMIINFMDREGTEEQLKEYYSKYTPEEIQQHDVLWAMYGRNARFHNRGIPRGIPIPLWAEENISTKDESPKSMWTDIL